MDKSWVGSDPWYLKDAKKCIPTLFGWKKGLNHKVYNSEKYNDACTNNYVEPAPNASQRTGKKNLYL